VEVQGYFSGSLIEFRIEVFFPDPFSKIDWRYQKNFGIRIYGVDLVEELFDSLSDDFRGCAVYAFTVVGAKHEDDGIYWSVALKDCRKHFCSSSFCTEWIVEYCSSSTKTFFDYSVAFCSYFVIQDAGPAGAPSISLISSSRD
jgi:hypothetical protein